MSGIWVAVNATTSNSGLSRYTVLKLWKSRPAAPQIRTFLGIKPLSGIGARLRKAGAGPGHDRHCVRVVQPWHKGAGRGEAAAVYCGGSGGAASAGFGCARAVRYSTILLTSIEL